MNLDAIIAGFTSALGLWVSVLLLVVAFRWAVRLMRS